MNYLYIGIVLGTITYLSWIAYYFLYLPKKFRHWFERSMMRLFALDATLTISGLIGFHSVSDSLTAVIAAATLGLLGTLTTIGIRGCSMIRSRFTSN